MYHLVSDAAMVLWHKANTPEYPSWGSNETKIPSRRNLRIRKSVIHSGEIPPVIVLNQPTVAESAAVRSAQVNEGGEVGFGAKLLTFGVGFKNALPWAKKVFFHTTAFPGGIAAVRC
jgi:carbonic anhydrase/acetyltransferase-like protein (isoleucine patch superfamily)